MRKTAIRAEFEAGEPRMFESRAQLAKRAAQYHPLDGQLVPRSSDAGLLAAIIAGEVPSCSDADWLADPKKRNNYTLGDGSTNIRLPDRNGKSSGTIGSVFARGDGDNAPALGAIHGDAMREIEGTFKEFFGGLSPEESEYSGCFSLLGTISGLAGNNTTVTKGHRLQFKASNVVPVAAQVRPVSISQVWAVKR